MKSEQIFNRRIAKFLREQPDASSTHFIQKVMSNATSPKDYYSTIKDLADKVGLKFFAEEVSRGRYLPYFKYDKKGLLKGEITDSDKEYIISDVPPMTFNNVITYLASEVVYKLKDVKNIEEIILKSTK